MASFSYKFPSGYTIDTDADMSDWENMPFGKRLTWEDFEIKEPGNIIEHLKKPNFSHELCLSYHDSSRLHISLDYLKPFDDALYIQHLQEQNRSSEKETEITKRLFPFLDFQRLTVSREGFFGFIPENFSGEAYLERESEVSNNFGHLAELMAEDTFIREYSPTFVHCYNVADDSEWQDMLYGNPYEQDDFFKEGASLRLKVNGKFERFFHSGQFMPNRDAREIYNEYKDKLKVESCFNSSKSNQPVIAGLEINFPYGFIDDFAWYLHDFEFQGRGWSEESAFSQEEAYNAIVENPEFLWESFKLSKRIYQLSLERQDQRLEDTINTLNRHLYHSDEEMRMLLKEQGSDYMQFTWEIPNPDFVPPTIKPPAPAEKRIGRSCKIGELLTLPIYHNNP